MIRAFVFLCALLLSSLALRLLPAQAATMQQTIGTTQVLLTLRPDPPTAGTVHGHVQLRSAPSSATTLTYSSAMPAMQMSGAGGSARASGNGVYDFDLPVPMASAWALDLHFTGGLRGTAHYQFAVTGGATATSALATSMSSGNVDAWRNAVFALVTLLVIGAFVLRRDRRPLTFALFSVAIIIVLALALLQNRFAAPAMDMSAMSTVRGSGATPVTLATVRTGQESRVVSAPATVAAYLSQDITARVSGIVSGLAVYVGDRVAAGQVLATLNAAELGSDAQAAAADAQAQAAAARAAQLEARHHAPLAVSIARNEAAVAQSDLLAAQADTAAKDRQRSYWSSEIAREESLYKQGAVSTQELQDERAQAAAASAAYQGASQRATAMQQQLAAARTRTLDAQAAIAMAQNNALSAQEQASRAASNAQSASTLAGYRTIIAPSNAVVTKRLIDPGVYVQAGTPILRVAVVDHLRIQANVAQQDLSSIHVGTPFAAKTLGGTTLRGRVSSVAPIADPATHTALVEAIIDGATQGISPGDYLRVTFVSQMSRAAGVQVPSAAIVSGGADAAVWIDVSGNAHRVPVRVLSDDGTTARVRGALKDGDRVVVDGAATLEDGQTITEQHG